jgi:hypothetical protein
MSSAASMIFPGFFVRFSGFLCELRYNSIGNLFVCLFGLLQNFLEFQPFIKFHSVFDVIHPGVSHYI